MAKQIIFTNFAFEDIETIGEYYFEISEALKDRFESDLFTTLQQMAKLPVSFSAYKKAYRCYKLPIFPYRIFYKEDDSTILIAAIIHTSRSNKFIKSRVQ